MSSLASKVALVTGGSVGIGAATAKKLVERGAKVAISGRRLEVGQAMAAQLNKIAPNSAIFVQGDVGNARQAENMVNATKEKFGQLNFLFNNAGIEGSLADGLDASVEDIQNLFQTNLIGQVFCTKFAVPIMKKQQGGGVIVMNSSVAATMPRARGTAGILNCYGATKAGLDQFVRQVSAHLLPFGIKLYSVNPMAIGTDMMSRIVTRPEFNNNLNALSDSFNPSGKLGSPDLVADVVMAMFDETTAFLPGDGVITESGYQWNSKVMYDHITDPVDMHFPKIEDALDARGFPKA